MKPYYDEGGIKILHADCRDVLWAVPPCDLVLTDPPYGIHKAAWDDTFPTDWIAPCADVAQKAMAVMCGINNILSMPRKAGLLSYRWMLSVHLTNGMTRGLMGFGNWIPVMVYAPDGESLYRPQQDAFECPVVGAMPDHPSPKPERAMTWILSRFEAETVLDPFMGSGTTLVAAKNLGRRAIGIEIEERYCEIAARRLSQSVFDFRSDK